MPQALSEAREHIDSIDRTIQDLIAERARWAHKVGPRERPAEGSRGLLPS
jgi:chorismate mutase